MAFYKELYTIPAFKSLLRKFWVLDNLSNSCSSAPKFALPNGCFTLAFITGAGIRINTPLASLPVKEGIYLFGQLNSRLSISIEPYSKAIMAQLHPWATSVFTTLPLNEVTNSFIHFKEVNKAVFNVLSCSDLFDENLVVEQFYRGFQPYLYPSANRNVLEHMCYCIQANNHNDAFKMANLAARLGYSARFIQKKFKNQIGLTPKEFQLIIKMRNLLKELKAATNNHSLTELALNYGFYDQSHFIKTFSGIMLVSPKNYFPEDYILPLSEIN
jgi:AraC-like DNA-binding protein